MPVLADRQSLPIDGKAGPRRRCLHHLDAFGHNFVPDIVAEQNSDLQTSVSGWGRPVRAASSAQLRAHRHGFGDAGSGPTACWRVELPRKNLDLCAAATRLAPRWRVLQRLLRLPVHPRRIFTGRQSGAAKDTGCRSLATPQSARSAGSVPVRNSAWGGERSFGRHVGTPRNIGNPKPRLETKPSVKCMHLRVLATALHHHMVAIHSPSMRQCGEDHSFAIAPAA